MSIVVEMRENRKELKEFGEIRGIIL